MKLFKKKAKNVKNVSDGVIVNDSGEELSLAVVAIVGGLKNALNRGEELDVAMQTFVNAGYDVNDVMMASQKIGSKVSESVIPKSTNNLEPVIGTKISKKVHLSKIKKKKVKSSKIKKEKVKSNSTGLILGMKKIYIIIFGIISSLVLIAALVLGLNWNKIFG